MHMTKSHNEMILVHRINVLSFTTAFMSDTT